MLEIIVNNINLTEKHFRIVVILLMLLFIISGILFAINTSTFNAPDERMHFNNIKVIGETGELPILNSEKVNKEGHQPPLYYWVMSVPYNIIKSMPERTQVLTIRIIGILLSSFIIYITYLIVINIFPKKELIILSSVLMVAMIPQFIFMSSVINNDVMANLIGALIILLTIKLFNNKKITAQRSIIVAVISILGFLTKTILWPMIIVLLLVFFYEIFKQNKYKYLLFFIPLALVAIWFFIRNYNLYGDILAASYIKDLWYDEQHKEFLNIIGIKDWGKTLYESFIARFAYFNLALPAIYYSVMKIIGFISGVGLVWYFVKKFKKIEKEKKWSLLLLISFILIIILGIFMYNLNYYQPQGRYLFPVVSAIAIIMMTGISVFIPKKINKLFLVLLFIGLIIINYKSLLILQAYA